MAEWNFLHSYIYIVYIKNVIKANNKKKMFIHCISIFKIMYYYAMVMFIPSLWYQKKLYFINRWKKKEKFEYIKYAYLLRILTQINKI